MFRTKTIAPERIETYSAAAISTGSRFTTTRYVSPPKAKPQIEAVAKPNIMIRQTPRPSRQPFSPAMIFTKARFIPQLPTRQSKVANENINAKVPNSFGDNARARMALNPKTATNARSLDKSTNIALEENRPMVFFLFTATPILFDRND